MSQTTDQMELREEAIRAHYPAATTLVTGFTYSPRIATPTDAAPERSPGVTPTRRFRSTTPGLTARRTTAAGTVSLRATIEAAEADDSLPSALQATALRAIRRALAIAEAIAEAMSDASTLSDMKRQNREGRLPAGAKTRFAELLTAEALAAGHTFANALTHLLRDHATEATVDITVIEEVVTDNAQICLQGLIWALDDTIDRHAADDAHLIAALLAAADDIRTTLATRAAHAPGLDAFTGARWHIAADDLTIDGFAPAAQTRGTPLTMTFKKPHEVVGNHIAKHQSLRLAKMLMAYDFDRRLNPFADLGGFIFTFMGDGAPGTGKTTLIQMMAGLLNDYCQVAGYTFRYQNFGIDNIDSYQGKSGQNAKAFIRNVLDPQVIGFGTIDDIDQIAGKRGDRQSSAGQQEVTAVFMEAFAGANTVVRGNCTFGMFSNFPENVDDALRQRAGARFLVDGPQTRDDYIDILTLLLGKNHDIPLGDHDLFAAQEITRAVASSFARHNTPQEAGLKEVFDQVQTQVGALDTLARLGTYLKAIQVADPRFTGRAIKNITDAIKVRAMDFELPDDWFETPDTFLHRDYATKHAMIAELRQPITTQMVVQEINRYADSEFRYADKSDAVAIDTMVRDMERSEAAKRRYLEGRT